MPEDRQGKAGWEPPPWEADAFEQMRRRRDEERADAEIAAAVADLGREESPAAMPEPVQPDGPAPSAEAEPGVEAKATLAEARAEALLVGLRAEEPKAVSSAAWIAGALSAGVLVVLGLVLLVWGFVAFGRTGNVPAGAIGSTIVIAFGGSAIALGAWLAHRTLKSKGVL